MRHYIIGLTLREAQGYAMRMKEEHWGHEVRILPVESVGRGSLRGISGENVEILVLPRAWESRNAVSLAEQLSALEALGVRVVTLTENEAER